MNWYAAHYDGDPAAENIFGREALKSRNDAVLQAWLDAGGGVGDFIRHAPARNPSGTGTGLNLPRHASNPPGRTFGQWTFKER
jgi:hypothetical protein